jgi:hypothetical protein
MAMQRLKDAAEKAKKELSGATSTNINIPFITMNQDGQTHTYHTHTHTERENSSLIHLQPNRNCIHYLIKVGKCELCLACVRIPCL